MTKLSASQAAKETGKSIPTITRAIKSGKLSGIKLDGGGYEIDAAELFRVFSAVSNESDQGHFSLGYETHRNTSMLEREIEFLKQRLADAEASTAKAEQDRDRWHEQARDAMLRIEARKPRGWLSWLRGD